MATMKAKMELLNIKSGRLSAFANSSSPTQIHLPPDDNSLIQPVNKATASQMDTSVSKSQGAIIQRPSQINAAHVAATASKTDEKDVAPFHQD